MQRVGALLLALLLALSLCACDDGNDKGFRLPISGEPRQLDPQTATDSSSVTVIATLFEGLTRLDADGNAVNGAASHTVSADGRTYTFTLYESYWSTLSIRRQKTAWDNPTRVTADDFLFAFQRALDPQNQSGTATALYAIENAEAVHDGRLPLSSLGVQVLDEYTLTVTLATPDNGFLAQLATTPCMPCNREFFNYAAGRYGLEKEYVLSNGAFSLTAWNHGDSLLLNKNEQYHAAATVAPQAIRYVQNPTDVVTALEEGMLDVSFLTAAEADTARKAGIVLQSLDDCVRQVSFNTTAAPLSNADIRRALRDAIEWATVYDYLTAAGEPQATGYIPPDATIGGEPYRTGDNAVTHIPNTDAASASLGRGLAALYPDDKSPTMPTVTLLAANDDTSANVARYLVQSWQKNLHIYCKMELVDPATLDARVAAGSYQIALHTAVGGGLTAADNLAAYTSGAGGNHTGFAEPAFDTLVKAAYGNRDKTIAAETWLREACPAIPLSFPRRTVGIAANTEGITVRPFGGGTYGGAYDCHNAKKFED